MVDPTSQHDEYERQKQTLVAQGYSNTASKTYSLVLQARNVPSCREFLKRDSLLRESLLLVPISCLPV